MIRGYSSVGDAISFAGGCDACIKECAHILQAKQRRSSIPWRAVAAAIFDPEDRGWQRRGVFQRKPQIPSLRVYSGDPGRLSGLNGDESAHLAAMLFELTSSEEVSFLLVDHDVDIVLERSHMVTVLDFGQVIAAGLPEQVRADERVRSAYLGDPVDSTAEGRDTAGAEETEDEHA